MRLFRHSSITQTLIVFLLPIFICSSIFLSALPTPSHAIDIPIDAIKEIFGNSENKSIQDYVKEFCDKRSGELMNLETWFSGKCGEDINSLSGEGVGFVDIIWLQILETAYSPVSKAYYNSYENLKFNLELMDKIQNAIKKATNASGNPISNVLSIDFKTIKKNNNISTTPLEDSLLFLLTKRPASSLDYFNYVASNLKNNHIIPETYAASPGYGFTGLTPLLPIWRAFRNISYIIFAFAFVIYGIMVMFRVRIDGKTAATITLAIPKLISTLIMITFSYAIVGFLIDLSTVASGLLINVLALGEIVVNPINGFVKMVSGQIPMFGGFLSLFINGIIAAILTPFIIFNLVLGGAIGALASVTVGIWGGVGALAALIVIIAVVWSYFKLVLNLFKCYFSVIVSLIFSPIILLGNIFPGSKAFSGWIMGIIGNLAAFPVASFFLTLSFALMMQPVLNLMSKVGMPTDWTGIKSFSSGISLTSVASGNVFGNLWAPPLTIPTNSYGDLMLATIGLGLLLMSSKYVDMVLESLKVPPFKYGAAIGEALKYGYGQVSDPDSMLRKDRDKLNEWIGRREGSYSQRGPGRITGNNFVDGGVGSDLGNLQGQIKK